MKKYLSAFKSLNFTPMQKMMLKVIGIVIGAVILIVLVFLIISLFNTKRSYAQIENLMVTSARRFLNNNPDRLVGGMYAEFTITVDELVEAEYMRELSRFVAKDVVCTGYVIVFQNVEKYYSYTPKLECRREDTILHHSLSLVDKIIAPENIVEKEHGLYYIEDGDYYLFRGNQVNNFVEYAGQLWRILRIDSDRNIRMIQQGRSTNMLPWDTNYNAERREFFGINDFEIIEDGKIAANSRFKDFLLGFYNNETIIPSSEKSVVIPQEVCIGKRKPNENDNSGEVECSVLSEKMNVGALHLYEYMRVSLDGNCINETTPSCTNFNFLRNLRGSFWTATAFADNSWRVWNIANGRPQNTNASHARYIRMVLEINGRINYISGDGSEANPYLIKVSGEIKE